MARIGVEKQALTDARFRVLGSHLLDPSHPAPVEQVEAAFGLYQCLRVWDYCIDRGLLVVYARDLEAIYPGLADALIDAELGESIRGSRPRRVRIRGGNGRLDWLQKKRDAGAKGAEHGKKGAEFGKLGGRPRKEKTPDTPVLETGVWGDTKTPPSASASASALEAQSGDSEVVGKAVLRGPSQKRKAAPCPYAKAAQTYAFESWERRHDTKPPWGSAEFTALAHSARLLKTLEAFVRSWDRYLRSTDRFDMGHDPKGFKRQLSRWAAAPEVFRQDGSRVCTRCGSSERDVTILASGICEPCDRHEKRGLRSV